MAFSEGFEATDSSSEGGRCRAWPDVRPPPTGAPPGGRGPDGANDGLPAAPRAASTPRRCAAAGGGAGGGRRGRYGSENVDGHANFEFWGGFSTFGAQTKKRPQIVEIGLHSPSANESRHAIDDLTALKHGHSPIIDCMGLLPRCVLIVVRVRNIVPVRRSAAGQLASGHVQ